ncbi:MAG: hypothetical protein JST01_24110 [Cyanobacteria bacterium SZAS TMP-1]|nr:hypothetical protein [Cyanobacteria bacterium SZAS TMP-1]
MISAWNGVVAEEDTVYYMCTKILIAGNHDRLHPKIGTAKRFMQSILSKKISASSSHGITAAGA